MEELETDYERAEYLQNLLVAHATGAQGDGQHYRLLRRYFLDQPEINTILPKFVRTNHDLAQFWQFIKFKFSTYAERREYIWSEFKALLEILERGHLAPADTHISDGLKKFDVESVHAAWSRALERRSSDPEGAITLARTLLETACKHILDEQGVCYNQKKIELHELYRLTSTELNLAPNQHTEEIFKQILGGCSAIVSGLGTLRNRLGDAHGKGKRPVRPAPRHSELAVNLAGSLALFLVRTWEARQASKI